MVSNNETNDEAEVRRKRLQALRNKQGQKGESPTGAAGGLARKIKARKQEDATGSDDTDDRKRQFIKKLIKKRMQEGGGEGGLVSKKKARKGAIGEAFKKKGDGAAAAGANMDKFPRLKAIIEQRRAKDAGEIPESVEELEHRVEKLEHEVRKTQDQLKNSKQVAVVEDVAVGNTKKKDVDPE